MFTPSTIDMRRFFAHKDQRAVVMYILGCMRLIDIYDQGGGPYRPPLAVVMSTCDMPLQ